MAEGIIFGDNFLSKEEFLIIFKDWYEQRGQEFKNAVNTQIIGEIQKMIIEATRVKKSTGAIVPTIKRVKGEYDAQKIYLLWENLSQEYFGNGVVTLIAAAHFQDKTLNWTNNVSESMLINKSGINIKQKALENIQKEMNDVQSIYAASEIQDLLNTHYANLLTTLSDYQLSSEEAELLHILMYERKSNLIKNSDHFTGNNYDNIIFSSQGNAEGKRLDAFMNHVGNYHNELFALMKTTTISGTDLMNSIEGLNVEGKGDTFPEIFSTKVSETQNWLLDALNNASWLTGGDIIVVGSNGEVIYNIQLKSTGKGKTFEVAVSALLNFAKQMVALIDENNPTQLAELMYTTLKTTTANDFQRTENFIESSAYDLVKQKLKLT